MKAFLLTAGTIFTAIVAAHALRIAAEPPLARDPWFLAMTGLAAVLALWAWRLAWRSRRP